MPLSLLLRLLARLVLVGAAGRMRRTGVPPAWRTPGQWPGGPAGIPPLGRGGTVSRLLAQRLGTAVEVARIGLRLLGAVAFLAATATLVAAGTTLVSLGPRWVGAVLLGLAALTLLVTVGELRVAIRLQRMRTRRRAADLLGGG